MKYLLSVLLVTAIVGGSVLYAREAIVCPVPIAYRLGQLDEDFGLTPEVARGHIERAALVWEDATGRDLFVYDESADFTIDFIFDERQAFADAESVNRARLDAAQAANEDLRNTIKSLQAEYDELAATFEAKRAAYDSDLASYNAEVQRYNDRGGAPKDIHEELERTREALNATARELSNTAATLNDMAANLNELSAEGNRRIARYNEQVNDYNDEYGFSREFTQGDYTGDSISIYKFSDYTELDRVLVHEFGHALGVGHVEGTSSIMYYLLEEPATAPTLSEEDIVAFTAQCGTGDELHFKIRALINRWL